ncbi:MAG: zinc ribbon domain-containing protein [Deltaproteobacteria bacterium]|nr:zinc ribbon domain-containing protein [Deltaproteobacteria bacterium]
MPIVACPQCSKPMDQDDGFCGSCGAIIDADLIAAVDGDLDPPTSPSLSAPLFDDEHADAPRTDPSRLAVVAAVDLGGFDERTDLAPPPVDDVPPPVDDVPPPLTSAAPSPPPPVTVEKPADAFQSFLEESTGAFVLDGAGVFEEETGSHRIDRQAMVQPQVVLRQKPGTDVASLSAFEQHVLSFLDGKRPLARLRKKAGLAFADLKVAISMLADRGVIEVVGAYQPDVRALLEDDDLADSGPHPTIPAPPPPLPAPPPPKAARPAPLPLPGQAAHPAAMPLPGQAPSPSSAASPSAPAPASPQRPSPTDAHARAQANALLERALAEQRAGKRQAAMAYMHMAAELLPGDPRIEELRRALMAR